MKLSQKLLDLRLKTGLRRYGHSLTQEDVVKSIEEMGGSISQSYLSLLESGKRTHLTPIAQKQLARFYNVEPDYLKDDQEDETLAQKILKQLVRYPDSDPIWVVIELFMSTQVGAGNGKDVKRPATPANFPESISIQTTIDPREKIHMATGLVESMLDQAQKNGDPERVVKSFRFLLEFLKNP